MNNLNKFKDLKKNIKTIRVHDSVMLWKFLKQWCATSICVRKSLSSITKAMQSDYKEVEKIASELQIASYKTYKLPGLRQMVVEHYHSVFSEIDWLECENAITAETFIQAPLTNGWLVEILLSDEPDLDNLMDSNIELDEDKNGYSTILRLSLVQDFFEKSVKKYI